MGLRDPPDPCRGRARPDDRGAGGADLPDDELPVPRHRARRQPVRPGRGRQHLHADHEPDAGRAGGPAELARGWRARRRSACPARSSSAPARPPTTLAILNLAGAGDHIVSSSSLYGGTYNLFHYTLPKLGIEVTFVDDPDDLEQWRAAVRDNTKALLRRDDPQPEERRLRHRGRGRRRPRRRRPADHRQHGAVAVPHPPARVGRRHRRAQPDQVPRRPRQLDRRGDRRRRHVRLRRLGPVPRLHRARPELPRPGLLAGARARVRSSSRPACSCCATSARRSRRSTPS